MNDEWLTYFGIQRVLREDSTDDEVVPIPEEAVDRINRRCLIIYPLSSSGARRLNVYDVPYTCSEKDKVDSIKNYDKFSRTDVKLNQRHHKKKKKQMNPRLKELRRRRMNRSYYDALDSSVRKRVGPTLRTLALDFSQTSPHFRYGLSEDETAVRMRQLEFGLSKLARMLTRKSRPCHVKLKRLDSLRLEAYSRPCVVRMERLSNAAVTSILSVPVNRLTPDQIATGLLIPNEALTHNLLQVRLSRFDSIFGCTDCASPVCALCQVSYAGDQQDDIDQDFQDPTFLIPESPPHQKLGLLEPEEIALPGHLSSLSGDQESGDSCDIASLASSSAASVAQTSDNCQGSNLRRESCSPPDSLIRAIGVPRKQLQLLRTSSYPMTAVELSKCKDRDEPPSMSSVKRKRRTLPCCSISRVTRRHRRFSLDAQSRVTRSTSKTLRNEVLIFENRSRSGIF